MAINKLIYSFNENPIPEKTSLAINSASVIGLGVGVYDGFYYIDYGDGKIFKKDTSKELIYNIEVLGNDVELFVDKNSIKSITTNTPEFNFSSSVFFGMNKIQSIFLNAGVSVNINEIPQSFSSFTLKSENSSIVGGYEGYNFNTTLQKLDLQNQSGTGLTSSEVDNLLIDLSLANWIGVKKINILGINASRTSTSDSAVTTLQNKGVTVNTN